MEQVTITQAISDVRIAEVLGSGDAENALYQIVSNGIKPNTLPADQMRVMCMLRQSKMDEAKRLLEEMMRRYPGDALTYKMVGDVSFLTCDYARARNFYGRALEKRPNDPNIVHDYAVAVASQGHLEEALGDFRKACEIAPDRWDFKHHLAIMLVLAGHEEEGWNLMEARLNCHGVVGGFPRPEDYWNGQPLDGKTLVVRTEQGFGDTINFMRYLNLVKRQKPKKVIVYCQPEMTGFIKQYWPWVEPWQHKAPPPVDFDYHINVMSFPRVFKGYVPAVPKRDPKEKGEGIGFCWFGSPTHKADHLRTIPVERFIQLANEFPQEQWYCLGYGFFDKKPENVKYRVSQCKGWDETIEALKGLRLIITVDTAMAHAGGFLGIPTWVLLPFVCDFRWGMKGETTKWYDSLKLYRQPKLFDWDSVMSRVRADLRALLGVSEQAVSAPKITAAAAHTVPQQGSPSS